MSPRYKINTKIIFLLEFSLAVVYSPYFSLSHMDLGSEHSFLVISCILQLDLIQMFLGVKEIVPCRNFSSTFFFPYQHTQVIHTLCIYLWSLLCEVSVLKVHWALSLNRRVKLYALCIKMLSLCLFLWWMK